MLCEGHGTGIEPAVDHLRNTVHLFAAFRAFDGNGIDVRTVQLNIIRAVVGHGFQLCDASDGMLMAALTLPDVQRSSPVTVTADAPVLYVLQPVAKTAFSDALRNPVDGVVVADQVVLHSGHLDEPGLACIVDQRSVASPAVRDSCAQISERRREGLSRPDLSDTIGSAFLTENAGPGSFRSHLTFGVYQLHKRQIIFLYQPWQSSSPKAGAI